MSVRSIVVDGDGYFKMPDGLRFNDQATGQRWLKEMTIDEFGACSFIENKQKIMVEAFDKPYVAQQVYHENGWEILLPYELRMPIDLKTLCLDEWDRFHGLTLSGMPFVMSRKAQAELFNLADDFSDDSISLSGVSYATPTYYLDNSELKKQNFWNERYLENPHPGWDLNTHHPSLDNIIPQLKPLKGRVGVLGCGKGHDAAYFASLGHIVTGFDISPEAIQSAQTRYGKNQNLQFVLSDALNLADENQQSFDYLFEHTFFCAIPPTQRRHLVLQWWKLLAESGHLLGIFFVNPKRSGPPYGGSEWELENLLEPYFDIRYWTRLKDSPGWRNGTELFVYAQRRDEKKK